MSLFTKHPHSVGETYGKHFLFAACAGIKLILGGVACLIHAVLPFLFETTGSGMAKQVLDDVAKRQNKSD